MLDYLRMTVQTRDGALEEWCCSSSEGINTDFSYRQIVYVLVPLEHHHEVFGKSSSPFTFVNFDFWNF
jgi:hypothetical protein